MRQGCARPLPMVGSAPLWADPIGSHSPGQFECLSAIPMHSQDASVEGKGGVGGGRNPLTLYQWMVVGFLLKHGKEEPVALENHVCLSVCLSAGLLELLPESTPGGFCPSLSSQAPPPL